MKVQQRRETTTILFKDYIKRNAQPPRFDIHEIKAAEGSL